MRRRAAAAATGFDPRRVLLGDVDGDGAGRPRLRRPRPGHCSGSTRPATGGRRAGHRDRHARRDRHRRRAAGRPARHRHGRAAVEPTPPTAAGGHAAVPRPDRRAQAVPARPDGQPPRRASPPCSYAPVDRSSTSPTRPTRRPAGAPRCRSRCRWSPGSRSTTQISGGRLTTEYRYHHGYWDGVEREFRGFGMVEQLDTETFDARPTRTVGPPSTTRRRR